MSVNKRERTVRYLSSYRAKAFWGAVVMVNSIVDGDGKRMRRLEVLSNMLAVLRGRREGL